MRQLRWIPLCALAVALVACGKADNGDGGLATSAKQAFSLFDPVADSAVIPFPNDGLFIGSTDGTLNIPDDGSAPFVTAANKLDGFSTSASLFADFIGPVDVDAANATSPLDLPHRAVWLLDTKKAGMAQPFLLTPGVDYTLGSSVATDPDSGVPLNVERTRLLIHPLKPLNPATTYLVVVTRQLQTTDGVGVVPADLFRAVISDQTIDAQLASGTEPALALLSASQRASLESIRQLYATQILPPLQQMAAGINAQAGATVADFSPSNLVIAWPFTTQSIGPTLQYLQANVAAQAMTIVATGKTTQDANPALPPVADVYVGSMAMPYYLADATASADDAAYGDNPVTSYWHADPSVVAAGNSTTGVPCAGLAQAGAVSDSTTACFPAPKARATQQIPVLVTIPNANSGKTMPASGWPVVIFQHGITGNRSYMLAVAPALAAAGFVTVAIDLPLHGLPPDDTVLRPANALFPAPIQPQERTFDLDLENNTTGAPGPDGVADPSGTWFINLASLLTSRDNLRQAASDLMTLTASVGGAAIVAPTGPGTFAPTGAFLDGNSVRYLGHSLGAIVTTTFLGVNGGSSAAVLANGGGGVAKLLDGSASFGPIVGAGLEAASGGAIVEGNDNFETFVRFAQTVVDDGDPVNYAAAAAANRPTLAFEVLGDAVVPNCTVPGDANCTALDTMADAGWLSGTDPLARVMNLGFFPGPTQFDGLDVPASAEVLTGADARNRVVRLNQGDHGTLLSPAASAAATCEMQGEAATFLATNGTVLSIGHPCP